MKKMLTIGRLLIVQALIVLTSCNENEVQTKHKVLTAELLPSQTFTINAERDTIIKGDAGTVLRIYKNSFVDKDGKPQQGNIEIELKEVLKPVDIILSGLMTTSNGQYLQTGGMIYINATAGGQPLDIAADKFIGTAIPNDKIQPGMKLFTGEIDSNGINWINPTPVLNDKIEANKRQSDSAGMRIESGTTAQHQSQSEIDAIIEYVESDTATIDKNIAIKPNVEESLEDVFVNEVMNDQGINLFAVDYMSSYIFSLKKLGWANIDRLYQNPRTQQIEMLTNIENSKDFNEVYITLIMSEEGLYIPGYQRKDGTYSFTHNDIEPTQLPVGQPAIILATAYKNNKPYYAIRKFNISEKQQFDITLEETTDGKLKETLSKQL